MILQPGSDMQFSQDKDKMVGSFAAGLPWYNKKQGQTPKLDCPGCPVLLHPFQHHTHHQWCGWYRISNSPCPHGSRLCPFTAPVRKTRMPAQIFICEYLRQQKSLLRFTKISLHAKLLLYTNEYQEYSVKISCLSLGSKGLLHSVLFTVGKPTEKICLYFREFGSDPGAT